MHDYEYDRRADEPDEPHWPDEPLYCNIIEAGFHVETDLFDGTWQIIPVHDGIPIEIPVPTELKTVIESAVEKATKEHYEREAEADAEARAGDEFDEMNERRNDGY